MKPSKIDLCVSLFYNRLDWDTLVIQGIDPFIHNMEVPLLYFICLNENRGDHIRLVLRTEKHKARSIAEKIDGHFKAFFIKFPSSLGKSQIKRNIGYHMDFENNAVYYGVYDFDSPDLLFGYELFFQSTSRLIILIFKELGKDTLSHLNEVFLQLLNLYFNTLNYSNRDIISLLEEILEKKRLVLDIDKWESFLEANQKAFEVNKQALHGYLSVFRNNTFKRYDTSWENEWVQIVNMAFRTASSSPSMDRSIFFDQIFDELSRALNIRNTLANYYLFQKAIIYLEKSNGKEKGLLAKLPEKN
ncbi:lantibiotic dehydratase C-terminal domain-containing protein [Ulvibacterium sp.]|uniref:lantibiotic dehydratase C-terminal domain-containing protein n=1 Tax=Ulvibacterium sp. TaxID=2665914 RepID=UPI003BAC7C4C